MNFFEAQAQARRRTVWLVLVFCAAVALITFVIGLVCLLGVAYVESKAGAWRTGSFWRTEVLIGVAIGVLLFVGVVSWVKLAKLSRGGHAVAERLGARRILPDSADPHERRFLNTIEEMAVASGVPVPAAYVLEGDRGVNALAAGFTPTDAAVIGTLGALHLLKRPQLQGIVAHEFSHILNGDNRAT